MIFRALGQFLAIITLGLTLVSCKDDALKVGVTAGPHAIIMEKVREEAQKRGLNIKIIEFNDFILPDAALDQKDLDLNSYQHKPFLENQIKTKGYKLVSLASTVLMPLGVYSKKEKDLQSLPNGAKIAIPNDPTNEGRALRLLEKVGLIKLDQAEFPTALNIIENPKKLEILEIEAPQLPRVMDEVNLIVSNTDWILLAGLDPHTALATEGADSPYVNIIAVRQGDELREDIKKFIEIYHSPVIKHYILEKFKGAILPSW